MSGGQLIEVVYGPVLLAASLAAIGFLIRFIIAARKELHASLNRVFTSIALLDNSSGDVNSRLQSIERALPVVKESLAVLAAEFENHERWHERHPE